ncbi:efflux RND transporter periplasmic adaptor subunit [Lysobacter sp. A6]|uniref:Efflux RND transporter periplasmic adaptor subunit n=1 Tax=Noviluteimonas lactosilytica TaxID=2888523 RepID=A0ABS8JLB4_9GAMM|nr:efflux RND transporter periplasmic adaptor subunit [Lysobacter lactosilyticus]MCC8364362.1 efflux RND transporter periplasmic adaptor subunit [Lysobacter lactosilyticus]
MASKLGSNPTAARTAKLAGALALALLVAACGGKDQAAAAPGGGEGGPPGGGMPPMPVEAVTLKTERLTGGLQTVGSLRADEQVVVRPEIAGRIERINFTEGSRVRQGQVLFQLDASIPQAAYNEAQANLKNSKSAEARSKELVAQKLIAQSDYDNTVAQHGVDVARAESARTALAKMSLRAPFDGQIGLRNVSVGAFVTVGQDLVTLVRLDPIEVDFSAPEATIAELKDGQKIFVTVDAFPGEVFDGIVEAIDPVIDATSRSARLRARLPNEDGRLRPGQFARLQLNTGTAGGEGVLVPEQALLQDGNVRFVYTVVDGKAHRVEIKTGLRVPGRVQVTEGLKAGDVVITSGQTKPIMNEGLAVQVLPAELPGMPQGNAPAKPATPAEKKQAAAKAAPQSAK